MNITVEDGIFYTDMPAVPSEQLQACFQGFLNQPDSYRKQHLQKHYGYAFDGYSYYGQKDSSNQAYDDLMETFVFSDFFPADKYPKSFNPFLGEEWPELLTMIMSIEEHMIQDLGLDELLSLHQQMGHMVSNNYYPAQKKFDHVAANNTRLSAHPDVSLFTIFPFGVDGELEYETRDGKWQSLAPTNKIVGFSGYLMEVLSGGKIKALNHRVKLSENTSKERFSFAFFSLPRPDAELPVVAKNRVGVMSGEEYFDEYLGLFD